MNMKKVFKILLIVAVLVSTVTAFCNESFAAYDWNSKITEADEDKWGTSNTKKQLEDPAKDIVGAIISVVRIIAVGIAIIMLAVLAMKYMMSAPGDRAEIKKHAVVYVVGALVLFASSGILGIIAKFGSSIN